MSARVFQGVLQQIKDVTDRMVGVINSDGEVIVCTDMSMNGKRHEKAPFELVASQNEVTRADGCTYKALTSWSAYFDYAVFVEGTDAEARSLCLMAAIALNEAKLFFDEKHDKATFVKNILLDNILPGDIYARARELHFDSDKRRVVFLVRQQERHELAAVDVICSLFPDRQHDYVVSLNEIDIALVKEIAQDAEAKDLRVLASAIEETLNGELYLKTVIGIGSPAAQLKDIASSYKEAQLAIEVGKVFEMEKSVINFEHLGIARLVYQLPTTMCEKFLSEVFKKSSLEEMDQETLFTVYKFFENNLNVSETARKLFVHRNTLVYRLEKIKKQTGLDLRDFDHAIIFKVALMVKKYLESMSAE